jgi:thymidylate synthase
VKDNRLNFIAPYVQRYKDETEDGTTIYGGYGPRLFGQEDQVKNVIALLNERPSSRRAVIQIFDKNDIAVPHKEIPCTTTLQFLVRDRKVDLIVTMRSNDAYFGLPHDVFCFTMIQEIVACTLGRDVGIYHHFAGSLHIYKDRWGDAQHFVDECYQQRIAMPAMPP